MKRALDLALFALSTWGRPYMYGVNGQVITDALIAAKARQYPPHYNPEKITRLKEQTGITAYQCNSYLSLFLDRDWSANQWRDYGTGGTIDTIPNQAGIAVFYNNHAGIYLGDGLVLESRGTFYGVVITKLSGRGWKVWRKYNNDLTYEERTVKPAMLQKGVKDSDQGGYAHDAVTKWQLFLISANIPMIGDDGIEYGADGRFGAATENGTKRYQLSKNIEPSGVVDYATLGHSFTDMLEMPAGDPAILEKWQKLTDAIAIIRGVINNADT